MKKIIRKFNKDIHEQEFREYVPVAVYEGMDVCTHLSTKYVENNSSEDFVS